MKPVETLDDLWVLAAEMGLHDVVTEGGENLISNGQHRPLEDVQTAEKLLLIQLS